MEIPQKAARSAVFCAWKQLGAAAHLLRRWQKRQDSGSKTANIGKKF
ncbi:MAG: hypothetical protein KH230_12535 [Enterocloster asparagiformis]|nr:hypothetical protein [Enterocloster asparagiformis]